MGGWKSMCKVADKLYLLSWGIYLFVTLWNQSYATRLFIGSQYTLLLCFCLLLLIVKEILKIDFSFKTTIVAFFFSILSVLVYLFSTHKMFLVMIFFIFSARNIDYKKIIKLSIIISAFVLLFVTIGALRGNIYNEVTISIINDRTRYFLGFTYMLIPAVILGNIVNLLMIYNKDELKWKYVILFIVANQFIFGYTDARLVYYLVCIEILIIIILKTRAKSIFYTNIVQIVFILSMPLACIFSYYVTINYDPADLYQYLINFVLEGRLELGQDALNTYGLPMFGTDIKWIGNGLDENGLKTFGAYNYVDCAYIHFLLDYGVIAFALFMGASMWFMYEMKRKKEVIILIVFSTMAIHNMIDDMAIQLHFNACLLFLGYLIPSKYQQGI